MSSLKRVNKERRDERRMQHEKGGCWDSIIFAGSYIFFIVPIPSFLLDIMLAVNISIALIILMNALFVEEVLDMSFFPTLLLFTTIFRISLNVSSTR